MLILSVVQVLFAATALAFCAAAAHAVISRSEAVGFHLMLAGSSAAIFFVSVPQVAAELPLIAGVTAIAGMLLAPRIQAIRSDDDDIDIGESTATRRLRK